MSALFTIADGCELDEVLSSFAEDQAVYAPVACGDEHYRWERAQSWDAGRHTLAPYRPLEPLKALLFPPREQVVSWDGHGEPVATEPATETRIVFGVKSCDLRSLDVHDHVFLRGGYVDPRYARARERTTLVTCDCADHLDVCFCPVVGVEPFPRTGFDVNLSPTDQGWCIESGTSRGAALVEWAGALLAPAGESLKLARRERRNRIGGALADHARTRGLEPGVDLRRAVETTFDSPLWQTFADDCVECGACNFICCTCHCFSLVDGVDASGRPGRWKQWDSCLFAGFARTAGGGSPRPTRASRLRNRFDKKFVYFPQTLGHYACDGCGRCTEACIGKIDIREVLRRAIDESGSVPAHSRDDRAGRGRDAGDQDLHDPTA